MNKLDKKQIPQFAALCVLSAGVFGYFVMKIVTPSPAAAGTRPHLTSEAVQVSAALPTSPTSAKPAAAGKAGTGTDAAPDPPRDADEAPAPTPGMRDPFVVGYVEPATASTPAAPAPKPAPAVAPVKTAAPQVASIHEVAPASVGTPALPFSLKGFSAPGAASPLPAAPKAAAPEAPPTPAWTVTGVLQSGAGQMAVLRNGDARRIVRTGDSVDSLYRVIAVTRSVVVLRHGATLYRLTLGAAKSAPAAPAQPTLFPTPAAPAPAPAAPAEDAQAPAGTGAALKAGLARMVQGALLMARSYMTPAESRVAACFAAPLAPAQETALAPLEQDPLDLSRDVYGDGQDAGGGAQWRCITASDLSAAGESPARFI